MTPPVAVRTAQMVVEFCNHKRAEVASLDAPPAEPDVLIPHKRTSDFAMLIAVIVADCCKVPEASVISPR